VATLLVWVGAVIGWLCLLAVLLLTDPTLNRMQTTGVIMACLVIGILLANWLSSTAGKAFLLRLCAISFFIAYATGVLDIGRLEEHTTAAACGLIGTVIYLVTEVWPRRRIPRTGQETGARCP